MNSNKGFTIVELLIAIVVLGVLASITVTAYNGVQTRAINTARASEAIAWHKQLKMYKAANGTYPIIPTGEYCLGAGYPDGDGVPGGECRDYLGGVYQYHENDANAVALATELKEVGTLPSGPRIPVNGTVGPYITYWSTGYYMSVVLRGEPDECPEPLRHSWDDGDGMLICYIEVNE